MPLDISKGGTASATAAGARLKLGITDLATMDPSNVDITGGTIDGVTITGGTISGLTSPLAIADGGTASTTAASARTSLFGVSTTTDNAVARYDGTTGALQNSTVTIDDSGNIVTSGSITGASFTGDIDADTLDGHDSTYFATATQGALADSAVQPGDLATIATTGAYSDLTGTPTASDLLTSIKTVDGSGSGLDADLLDGQHGSYYQTALGYTPVNKAGDTMSGGLSMGSATASGGAQDLSRHIALWGSTYGFSITGGALNYNVDSSGKHYFFGGSTYYLSIGSTGVIVGLTSGGYPGANKINAADYYISGTSLNTTLATFSTSADLSSTSSGKGASLIGINDSGGLITATTVEGALAELATDINAIPTPDYGAGNAALAAGAIGTYAFGGFASGTGSLTQGTDYVASSTKSGLKYAYHGSQTDSISGQTYATNVLTSTTMAGTQRLMSATGLAAGGIGLFMRVA